MKDPDGPGSDPLFINLDLTRLGDALVRLALTARQLGHARTAHTVQDYWHPCGSLEMEFVRDVFSLNPDDIAERWFGGEANAVRLTNALREAAA